MCKIYQYIYDCGHGIRVCTSKCQGQYATPNTRHLQQGRRKSCRRYPELYLRISSPCGTCQIAATEADYDTVCKGFQTEIEYLQQKFAASFSRLEEFAECAKELEEARKKLLEFELEAEAVVLGLKESFPARNAGIPALIRDAAGPRRRGSLLRREVLPRDITEGWHLEGEYGSAEESGDWREDESGAGTGGPAWGDDWDSEDVVLRDFGKAQEGKW